jgi:cation-transporting ATPase 13A1
MADWLDKAEADAAASGAGSPFGGAPTDDDPPLLKPGDASMAAPFTAKSGGVAPVAEVLKQGRCTLVTTVQMFKILGLLCLSTAYTLSALYLAGVKLSDAQATLGGVLQAGMFFFLSSAKPLEKLSLERPHPSIFCAYFFLSLLGQAAAQLAFVVFAFRLAEKAMPPGEKQKPDGDFAPNLVNSACYLAEQAVQLTTFGVNYVGYPHNTPLMENGGMSKALKYAGAFWLALAAEAFPSLNEGFGLVPMPAALRGQLVAGAVAVAAGTFFWERGLRALLPAKGPPVKGYMAHERELGLEDFGPEEEEEEVGGGGGARSGGGAAARETKKRR